MSLNLDEIRSRYPSKPTSIDEQTVLVAAKEVLK